MFDQPPRSLPTLAATAWRLVDVGAAGPGGPGYEPDLDPVTRALVESEPFLDEILAEDALAESRELAPDVGRMAALLASSLLTIQDGMVCAQPHVGWPLLARLIDVDLLVPAFLLELGNRLDDPLRDTGWPTSLDAARTRFDRARSGAGAEVHVHLGGSLPTGVLWAQQLVLSASLGGGPPLPTAATWFPLPEAAVSTWLDLHKALPPRWGYRDDDSSWPVDRLGVLLHGDGGTRWPFLEGPGGTLARILSVERYLLGQAWTATLRGDDRIGDRLLRYLQVRNAFHKGMLSGVGGRGLRRFRRAFSRRWVLVEGGGHSPQREWRSVRIERGRVACALEAFLPDCGLAPGDSLDVELRVSPPVGRTALKRWTGRLAGLADALEAAGRRKVRAGFVVHLLRPPLVGPARALAAEALPPTEVQALLRVLEARPTWRSFLVGLDAAGEELAAPPRSFAASFHLARVWSDHRPGPALGAGGVAPRLGFTFHAGEDFRDLLTGIRHVDEAANLLAMRPGDRLGHATALAWRAGEWYADPWSAPRVDDHALDLLWACAVLQSGDGEDQRLARGARARLASLLRELKVGRIDERIDLALAGLDPDGAAHRPDPREQRRMLDDSIYSPGHACPLSEAAVLRDLGLGPEIPMNRVVPLNPRQGDWMDLVDRCRARVGARVSARGLVIEANPTSNLVISGLRAYNELPYLRLEGGEPRGFGGIAYTIGTDDPAIFQTSLWGEYVRVGEALVGQGLTPEEVANWLSERRATAARACFIPKDLPSGAELADVIRASIEARLPD